VLGLANPILSFSWVGDNLSLIGSAIAQHVELTLIAVGVGFGISLPLSLLIWRVKPLRAPIVGFAALLYTIPSIALFALVQPITGYFSVTTGEVALVSYTLLILIRNTVAGLDAVSSEVHEAAKSVGYSPLAAIVRVDLPLALPAIFAGLRVATVTTVGLVTVTAFIGLGGLGQLVIDGFNAQVNRNSPIVVGLACSVFLAAIGDLLFVLIERGVVRWARPVQGA
jgi:osmoprotectant transport system permease protein